MFKTLFQLPRSWELRSGAFFLVASVGTGLCNYLFQVVAARQLSSENFSQLNGWFADLALFFMFGGVLQFAANFWPSGPRLLRPILVIANALAIAAITYWLTAPGALTLERVLMILVVSTLFSWLMGQVQIRLQFTIISLVNVLGAVSKLGLSVAPFGLPTELNRYAFAMFATYLPGLWIISVYLWSAPKPEPGARHSGWSAPILLSIATAITPQFDLVLMHHTQTSATFAEFAQASLFYKAIYFLIFILAQWLLPRQVKHHNHEGSAGLPAVAAGGLVLALGLTLISPWISRLLLSWPQGPARSLVFLSCVHTTLLALIFLTVQGACARRDLRLSGLLLAGLALEAGVQMLLRFEANNYLLFIIAAQIVLLVGSHRLGRQSITHALAPAPGVT